MVKMQNISDFRMAVTVGGKRILMNPGDVIQSERELVEPFLQVVADDTPVTTLGAGPQRRKVDQLEEKLASLESEKEALAAANTEQVAENIGDLQAQLNDLRTDLEEEIQQVRDIASALRDTFANVKEGLNQSKLDQEEENKIVQRRLGILKSALMTMEEAIYGPAEENSGN